MRNAETNRKAKTMKHVNGAKYRGLSTQIERLESQAEIARGLQFNASQMLHATGVVRMGRELDGLYRSIDALRSERAAIRRNS